jgi:hypothetical protein
MSGVTALAGVPRADIVGGVMAARDSLKGSLGSGGGKPGSAGVPRPDRGDTKPLGGTGILMSSGDPGMRASGRPGMKIRLASF